MVNVYKNDRAYKTIGEVARELGLVDNKTGHLKTYTIRYWETQFKQIKPSIGAGNRRYYSKENFELIKNGMYYCKSCDFSCSKKSNFDAHLSTKKHAKKAAMYCPDAVKQDNTHKCENCLKTFKSKSGLWKHRKTCVEPLVTAVEPNNNPTVDVSHNALMNVVMQNNELLEQQLEIGTREPHSGPLDNGDEVVGDVTSLIPLRNRRTTSEGDELLTRITEGLTRFTCDGHVGWGLSEYLDQIVEGLPLGAVL